MRNLVPLTKILLTLGTAVWAIVLHRPESLLALCALEVLILLVSGELFKNLKALIMLIILPPSWEPSKNWAAAAPKNR